MQVKHTGKYVLFIYNFTFASRKIHKHSETIHGAPSHLECSYAHSREQCTFHACVAVCTAVATTAMLHVQCSLFAGQDETEQSDAAATVATYRRVDRHCSVLHDPAFHIPSDELLHNAQALSMPGSNPVTSEAF